jgi:hypothetical protein
MKAETGEREGQPWLLRIPDIFEPIAGEVMAGCEVVLATRLGQEYYSVKAARPRAIRESEVAKFIRWNLPLDHAWPCNPRKMEGFIEKAAQTLLRKFADRRPQGVFIGQLNAGSPDRYYKSLAANLRGRLLQLFPELAAGAVAEQDPTQATLFGLVGKEGLFCGLTSPREANGFYPGGSFYVDQKAADTISRAGGKIAEALHYLGLHRPALAAGSHWLELGACPGGMTSELLARGQRVTAIDRAALDKRMNQRPGLKFYQTDVALYTPEKGSQFDALLSDLNGPPEDSIAQVIRLAPWLRQGAVVILTLKLPKIESVAMPCAAFRKLVKVTQAAGLRLFAHTHLTYNKNEFTLFFEWQPR